MKNKIYIIDGKTYLSHINDEVHLYGLLHQLAFLAGRIKDEEDVFHVLDAAKRYGEIAEEKFQSWGIPGRYLVFGDPKDLKGLMDKELDEVEERGPEGDRYASTHPCSRTAQRAEADGDLLVAARRGVLRRELLHPVEVHRDEVVT